MRKTAVKALLFDLGGVVLSVDFGKVFQSWATISELDEEQIKSRFKMDELYQQHEKGLIEPSHYIDHLRSSMKLTGTDQEVIKGWNAIFGTEFTASLDAIDSIRSKIPTYGFSNTNYTHQVYWEKYFPRIPRTFEKMFVSSEIGLRKPDAEAFEFVLEQMSVKPEELLFFDDTQENIEGASRLGIETVLVTGSDSVVSALAALNGEGRIFQK